MAQPGIANHPSGRAWLAAKIDTELFSVWREDFHTADLAKTQFSASAFSGTGTASIVNTLPGGVVAVKAGGTGISFRSAYASPAVGDLRANRKRASFRARVKFDETVQMTQNIAVGVSNKVQAGPIVGASGILASGTFIALCKVAGQSVWYAVCSNGSAQRVEATQFQPKPGVWYWLEIGFREDGTIDFYIDNALVFSETVMQFIPSATVYATIDQNLAGTNNDALYVDRVEITEEL